MEKSLRKRLVEFMGSKGISVYALANTIGVQVRTLNNQVNGDTTIPAKVIMETLYHNEDLSAEWLLRGEGDMLRSSEPVAMDKQGISKTEKELRDTIRRQQREIDGLYERIEELKKTSSIAATLRAHTA